MYFGAVPAEHAAVPVQAGELEVSSTAANRSIEPDRRRLRRVGTDRDVAAG
jgi:hypothetical protein